MIQYVDRLKDSVRSLQLSLFGVTYRNTGTNGKSIWVGYFERPEGKKPTYTSGDPSWLKAFENLYFSIVESMVLSPSGGSAPEDLEEPTYYLARIKTLIDDCALVGDQSWIINIEYVDEADLGTHWCARVEALGDYYLEVDKCGESLGELGRLLWEAVENNECG